MFFTTTVFAHLSPATTTFGIHSYWIFAAATTNLEFTLRVRDTNTGKVKIYFNPQSRAADALIDVNAFPGC